MKIGVFDSGIGGLTILKALTEVSPNNEYIYFGDTLNLPYGEKRVDELKQLSNKIIEFLISHEVDAIVIACGTLSSTIYDSVKSKYDVKIYTDTTTASQYLLSVKNNYANTKVDWTYKELMDKIDDKTYILSYVSETSGKVSIVIKQATTEQINAML